MTPLTIILSLSLSHTHVTHAHTHTLLHTHHSVNPNGQGDYSKAMRIPWMFNALMCAFILLIPIVMLNTLVAILGNSYEAVTRERFRVTLQQQMRIVMKAEATFVIFKSVRGILNHLYSSFITRTGSEEFPYS